MNDQLIRDLLHEAADDIEPGDRLDAIRAATAPTGRRTHRGWWVAGGAGLVAASVVTALALTTGGAPQSKDPDLASPPISDTADPDGGTSPVAVYFVGDTAEGPRLYREFRPNVSPRQPWIFALPAAVNGNALDPDYRSFWPTSASVNGWGTGPDGLTVSLAGVTRERPAGMSEEQARLAIEQLVRTAQGVHGQGKVPVQVYIDGNPSDMVLGVPTAEPLIGAPDADVLAPVSLSDPNEGLAVDRDELFTVRGRGTSADGAVQILVKSWEGTAVVADSTVMGALSTDRLSAFAESFDLSDVSPGEYDVIATVTNADGTVDSDTRRITVTY